MFEELEKKIDEAFVSDGDRIFSFANKLSNVVSESVDIHMSHPMTSDGIKLMSHIETFLNIIPEDQQSKAYNAIKAVENAFEGLLDEIKNAEVRSKIIQIWGKIIDLALDATKRQEQISAEPKLSFAEDKKKNIDN